MAISASKDFIVFPNDNAGKISVNESVFTSNGTWTAPSGITSAQVILVGGGGGGGGGSQNVAAGGGGGGQVITKNVTVVPGTSYAINIGAGGQGGQGALLTAADVTSTLPGSNGGSTTFGALTIANLLPDAWFDFAPAQWDGNYIYRQISGISGQSILTVYPNTNGIDIGMSILGIGGSQITNMPASPGNVVVAKTTNTVTIGNMAAGGTLSTLSGNLASAGNLGVLAAFDYDDARTKPSTIVYNNISGGTLVSNPQTIGAGSSPLLNTNYSNNLLVPQLAQFEETNVAGTGAVAGTLVRIYGTSAPTPVTTLLTSPATPKLPEMLAPFTRFITATNGSAIVTVDSTVGLAVDMLLTLPTGTTGVAVGTTIISIDSATQVTVQAPSASSSGTYNSPITANLSSQKAFFSYSGSTGAYAIKFVTPATANTSNIWVSLSSLNNTSSTTGTTSSAGTSGIPWQPGATYVFSFYISSDVDIATSEMSVQLRSANATTMATNNVQYTGGSTGQANSIDTGTVNGFFVREVAPNTVPGVGGDLPSGVLFVSANASSGATSFTVCETPSANPQYDLTSTIIKGMTIVSAGYISSSTIQAVSYATAVVNGYTMQTATVTVSSGVVTANLTALSTTFTLTRPSGVLVIGTNTGTNANGWRRVYAYFNTLPTMQTYSTAGGTSINQPATASNLYAYGSQPNFVYPVIVFKRASATVWIDNAQLELATATNGGTPTSWMPPIIQGDSSLLVQTGTATLGNLETSHRFVKASATTNYYGSAYVVSSGTGSTYRPYYAWIEFFDADYNSLGRTDGSFVFTPISGLASANQFVSGSNYTPTYPVRVGVTGTSPSTTAWVKFGVAQLQGAQTNAEFSIFYPQLELGTSATSVKRPIDGTYTWAGQPGNSALISISGSYGISEGGGGGGTWNSNNPFWLFGLQGGNNGGHAANNNYQLPTLAGGGAGAGGVGGNGVQYVGAPSNSTINSIAGGWNTSAGLTQSTFPLRGNYGGYAVWNTTSAGGVANAPGYAGDGGLGVWPFGLNGNPTGVALGGGGGGAGWVTAGTTGTATPNQIVPGRGQGGGGKGGGTNLVQALSGNVTAAVTDYYARGIDGQPNTGGGGGGGGSNLAAASGPLTGVSHYLAARTVNADNAGSDATKWTALYNAAVQTSGSAALYGSNGLRVTIQDVGNARIQTTPPSFAILPRTPLIFTGVAARLTGPATTTVTSSQFPGFAKRARPVIRWRAWNGTIIREDRPAYDIIFAAVNTTVYLGPNSATNVGGTWETGNAPANAFYFDVIWEFLYMDGSDQVDVDIADLQFLPYLATGGNGADGLAIVRWFDKTNA